MAGSKRDQSASVEIPGYRQPNPALPSFALLLVERDQPIAFDGLVVGNEIGIGRAGALDNSDAGQNRLPAARSVRAVSGPISR